MTQMSRDKIREALEQSQKLTALLREKNIIRSMDEITPQRQRVERDTLEALRLLDAEVPVSQEPVAWTTKLALEVSEQLAGSVFGVIDVSVRNIWGDQGIPLYAAPVAPAKTVSLEGIMEVVKEWFHGPSGSMPNYDVLRSRLSSLLDPKKEQDDLGTSL